MSAHMLVCTVLSRCTLVVYVFVFSSGTLGMFWCSYWHFFRLLFGKLFSNLSFLSFQLGNICPIRKFSFFHHAGGGRGHDGELCYKISDF